MRYIRAKLVEYCIEGESDANKEHFREISRLNDGEDLEFVDPLIEEVFDGIDPDDKGELKEIQDRSAIPPNNESSTAAAPPSFEIDNPSMMDFLL